MSMTRAEMEEHLAAGRSIVHEGWLINTVEALPGEAELVGNDPLKLAEAQQRLEGERDRLQAELDALKAQQAEQPPKDAKPAKTEKAKE